MFLKLCRRHISLMEQWITRIGKNFENEWQIMQKEAIPKKKFLLNTLSTIYGLSNLRTWIKEEEFKFSKIWKTSSASFIQNLFEVNGSFKNILRSRCCTVHESLTLEFGAFGLQMEESTFTSRVIFEHQVKSSHLTSETISLFI